MLVTSLVNPDHSPDSCKQTQYIYTKPIYATINVWMVDNILDMHYVKSEVKSIHTLPYIRPDKIVETRTLTLKEICPEWKRDLATKDYRQSSYYFSSTTFTIFMWVHVQSFITNYWESSSDPARSFSYRLENVSPVCGITSYPSMVTKRYTMKSAWFITWWRIACEWEGVSQGGDTPINAVLWSLPSSKVLIC